MAAEKKSNRRIGAHVSAAGGQFKAVERVAKIGGNCLQLFSGSPQVWKRKPLDDFDFEKVFEYQKKYDVQPIFTHVLYLINLASDKPDLVKKSIDVLKYDLQFDAKIGGSGIVVHLGSHQGRGWEAVKIQVRDAIAEILSDSPKNSTFLIEPSAGQNGKLCSDLAEVKWLLDELQPKFGDRLGWCVDTCHSFAAGYYLGESVPEHDTAQKNVTLPKSLVTTISDLDLWKSLKCIHANDSRDPYGSGRDRHHNLGDGEILLDDFRFFLTRPELDEIPVILEVPGLDKNGPDAENMARLKKLIQ